jgi:hypothetical protein
VAARTRSRSGWHAGGGARVTVLLAPYVPATSEKLLAALGSPGGKIAPLEPLFPKRA